MKNLIKKNQLMITALAIMIAIAGYLQFAGTGLEEEYLTVNDSIDYTDDVTDAGSGGVITENYIAGDLWDLSEEDLLGSDIESLDSDSEGIFVEDFMDAGMQLSDTGSSNVSGSTPEEGEIPGEAVFTTSGEVTIVLSDAKLLKEQTRARNKETLLEIINSTGLTDEQKQAAVDSMVRMTEIAEKETETEIMLEAKLLTDVVVSISEDKVDVMVNADTLDEARRAQIEDIVKRKTDIDPENIIISAVSR